MVSPSGAHASRPTERSRRDASRRVRLEARSNSVRRPWSLNALLILYERQTRKRPSGEVARLLVAEPAPSGERTPAAAAQIDGDDIALVHHSWLGSEVNAERELASIRTDVVVVGGRRPWLQSEASRCEKVARTSGGDVDGHHMRLAAIGEPAIPETEFAALGYMRLHLGILALLHLPRLRLLAGNARPHKGYERDPFGIGKPAQRRRSGRQLRQALRLAAVGGDHVDLRLVVVLALGGERDPASIGRPYRLAVLVARGQPPPSRAVCRKKPEIGARLVAFHVVAGHRGACVRSVGRDRRHADTF